jgi:hypothetical protein
MILLGQGRGRRIYNVGRGFRAEILGWDGRGIRSGALGEMISFDGICYKFEARKENDCIKMAQGWAHM